MIQRIQSLYLFLASMAGGALLMPSMTLYSHPVAGAEDYRLTATAHIPLLLIAVVMTVLPLITIFMFKERKRQKGMTIISILNCITFLVVVMMKVANIRNSTPKPELGPYGILGTVMPVLAIIFLFLALAGIRRDEKIIRDADRLR